MIHQIKQNTMTQHFNYYPNNFETMPLEIIKAQYPDEYARLITKVERDMYSDANDRGCDQGHSDRDNNY